VQGVYGHEVHDWGFFWSEGGHVYGVDAECGGHMLFVIGDM
jgi:hypothetical protein